MTANATVEKARSADGTSIAYERAGTGPPLFLVDAALGFRGFGPLGPLAAELASSFTVITYDRRGRGESTGTPREPKVGTPMSPGTAAVLGLARNVGAAIETTSTAEGAAWSAAASGWVKYWTRFAAPAREAVAQATVVRPGDSVLDVGCGSGEFCELVAALGARVSGIDAAASMVELARRRVPDADLRVGPIEQLPWPDGSFDLVAGFNAFQFTADFVAALAEARRVARLGERAAVCNCGRIEDREVHASDQLPN